IRGDLDTDPEEHGYDGDDYSSDESNSEQETVWGSAALMLKATIQRLFRSQSHWRIIPPMLRLRTKQSLSEDKDSRTTNLASTILFAQ
ncbi:hypothetical protein BGX21_007461, partial [Mortierella sp. AD011]